jgi:hypothetical protein
MAGVERAVVWGAPVSDARGVFASLADSRGFTQAECRLAARTGRLAAIIACPPLEGRGSRLSGRTSGAVALNHLQQLKGRLLDEQLRAAGLL